MLFLRILEQKILQIVNLVPVFSMKTQIIKTFFHYVLGKFVILLVIFHELSEHIMENVLIICVFKFSFVFQTQFLVSTIFS